MLGFYMSSHPLTRHAALLQALATHRVADLAGVPEKAEVILGGMIANVQVRNVQKSRSGLTRMAKFTFEDLTGSVPAMLWPEEFAKFEELVKNDLIGFVKGTLDRRRDPAELIVSKIIPLEHGRRRAVARGGRHAPQGAAPGRTTWSACSARSGSGPGNLDVYLEILGLERRPPRDLQGRRLAARSATTTGSSPTSKRPSAPATSACSASAAPPPVLTRLHSPSLL